ncbi:DUF4129 domain-containing transglutaminase family protein [Niallia endozanthoxylica]|uniref:Transglutaminase domain-containing protein n=1 Tax=Niallia endozanthoxylica TaxID=2036016 RepID=A0A5J5H5K2_9BACI|nr:transglutaminase domain-containing protein [Niallia endozanthoxylica]KAA9015949.1 transglutaminase domain-containing protein [Niallia endozanthoxylica]
MKQWHDVMSLLLYGLGFLLLLEWIWPIKILSETADIWVFLLFLLLCFLLFFLRAPIYVNFLLKGGAILFFLQFLYFEEGFLSIDWLSLFIKDIKLNIGYMFDGNLQALTHLFRSLAFFIVLWMMVYLLEYWLFRRKQIFLFFFMTIVYVAFLDTFTPYDASGSMVRIVLIGFIIIGILTFQRQYNKEKLKKETIVFRKWLLFLSMIVLFSSFLGYILPKAQPIWPDPVPYLKVFNGMGTMKKVGYGEDDTQLGGSITGDSTVVFQTIVESPHYWKVETKDVYTGKGWVQSEDELKNIRFSGNRQIPITSFVEGVNYEQSVPETSTVHQLKDYSHLLYPLGVTKIQSDRGYSFELDSSIEKIYSYQGPKSASLEEYSLTYEIPFYTEDMLRTSVSGNSALLDASFMLRYTQLPAHLPSRVKELAVKITKGKTNNYDKAKALEQYFKTNQYSYSLNDVAIPNEDEDYVDQFLFETMKGYCDNFSTSMVVLLRSLDIPARWVKGYTEGRFTGMEGNLYKYEITNNNAHSWVEVYFPQIGWVPFEPTPGFANEAAANIEEDEKQEGTEASVQLEQQEEIENEQNEEVKKEEKENKRNTAGANAEGLFAYSWVWSMLLVLVLLLAFFYIYCTRSKWLSFYYIRKLKYAEKDDAFLAAYDVLLKQLNRIGMTRDTGQTLREYAKKVDEHYSTTEMTLLTKRYEEYLYGNQIKKGTWLEVKELWENLIKKTIA